MPSKELVSFIVVSKLTLQRYNDFHYYFYCTTDLYIIISVSIGFNNNKTGLLVFFEIHHHVGAYYILSPIPYYHHQSRNSNLPLLLLNPSCLIWDCPLFVINAARASHNSSNAFPPLFCVSVQCTGFVTSPVNSFLLLLLLLSFRVLLLHRLLLLLNENELNKANIYIQAISDHTWLSNMNSNN